MAKSTKCRVGDLAVVVNAQLRCNLGNIVRVIAADDGHGVCVFKGQGHVWTVTCNRPMTWIDKGVRYRSKTGPVPDNRLQPIRGATPGQHDDQGIGLGVESVIDG
jgi:hypothetical protein